MRKSEIFQLRLETKLKEAAKAEAERRGVTLGELVRVLLVEAANVKD
jgi:antitoxin component of RelBE/YafQ-DinJ toxin-antitoxin module